MHEAMIEQIAESRGYDRGYSVGRKYSHELINELIEQLKCERSVAEEDGLTTGVRKTQAQIDILEQAKLCLRAGSIQV